MGLCWIEDPNVLGLQDRVDAVNKAREAAGTFGWSDVFSRRRSGVLAVHQLFMVVRPWGSNPLSSTPENPRPHGLGFFAGWGPVERFDDSLTTITPLMDRMSVPTLECEGQGPDR
jgi:hypothetical protein